MKTKGDTIIQDGQLVIRHRVDPAAALRSAELKRQLQSDKSLRDGCVSAFTIPHAVLYGYAREKYGMSPREAFRSFGEHNVLMALINDRDYSKFLTHEDGRKLANQSFGDGEA